MEYKADPAIKNRRGRTPCDVSHNTNINNILQMTEFEFVNVSRYREPPPIKVRGKLKRRICVCCTCLYVS